MLISCWEIIQILRCFKLVILMPGLKGKQTTNLSLIIPYQVSYQEQECKYVVY